MNALFGIGILAAIIYGIVRDAFFWKIYGVLFVLYLLFVALSANRKDNHKRRTITLSTWSQPSDPTSYLCQELNLTKAMAYVKKLNSEQSEVHYTLSHIMGHALAWGAYKMRRDIGRIKWGFFKHDKKIGTTSLVEVDGGKDLIPVTFIDAHEMTLKEYAMKISEKVKRAKARQDKTHEKQTASMKFLPSFLAQPLMFIMSYLSIACGNDIGPLNLKKDSFGHIILTNIGTLGLSRGFAPLCPPMHALGLFCIGAIEKRPVVDQKTGEIVVADMASLVGTGDHRFGDAVIFAPLFKCYRGYVEDPENFDPKVWPENAHHSEKKDK